MVKPTTIKRGGRGWSCTDTYPDRRYDQSIQQT